MNKFLQLVIKEIRELLTPQMIIPFLIMVFVFMLIGSFIEGELEKTDAPKKLVVLDLDNSEISNQVSILLEENNYDVTLETEGTPEEIETKMEDSDQNAMIVIPNNFSESLQNGERVTIQTYTIIRSFSGIAGQSGANVESIVATLNELVSNILIGSLPEVDDVSAIKYPVEGEHFVSINNATAPVAPSVVYNFINSQITFIPIILFLVITIAAQLVATAIATEKENKTLETLLASPISRKAIVAAKLLAAGLISMVFAATYMIGLNNLSSGITGAVGSEISNNNDVYLGELGLQFSELDYLLLGVVIFLGIMVALSLAFILGAFAKDSRSAQGVIAPVMMMLLIPYLLSMMIDINQLSTLPKVLLYAIPFTHTFTAATNILLENYQLLFAGIIYNIVIIGIAIVVASRLFSTEKILTAKLPNFLSKS